MMQRSIITPGSDGLEEGNGLSTGTTGDEGYGGSTECYTTKTLYFRESI